MGYRTILTVITEPELSLSALEAAISMAAGKDAHLEVLCMGIDHTQAGHYYAGANAMIQQETLARARDEAVQIEAAVKARLEHESITWSADALVTQTAGISSLVAQRARFCDLAILPPPYGEARGIADEAAAEAAMFEGKAPLLVVPGEFDPAQIGRKIVIAWNQSPEALTAIRTALPYLKAAERVNICIIDPPKHGPDRSDPGGALSMMLSRHGVNTEISVLAKTMPRVSDVLRRHMQDIGADMMVMGAYGHSRFREAIMGGATRNMLENSNFPVLMAH